ncbi:pancreatic polypeptide receptor [Branchiostoma belcheri]|nr:pancreatic polypeptide receptor [Branchiostoma belcheri]
MGDDSALSLIPETENSSISAREMVDGVDLKTLMDLWQWYQRAERNTSLPRGDFDGFPIESRKDVVYPTAKASLGVVYSLIIMVCGVGNTLLLLVLFKYKKTRNTANLLIANLALSDLIVAVCCIPFDMDYYVVRPRVWVHGDAACAVVNFVKTVSMYVSTNALLVIALDRRSGKIGLAPLHSFCSSLDVNTDISLLNVRVITGNVDQFTGLTERQLDDMAAGPESGCNERNDRAVDFL